MTLEFGSVDEAMSWADDWVNANSPIRVADDLAAFEADHLEQFLANYRRGFHQFYVEFGELAALVDQVNFVDRSTWPSHRALQFVTIAKNLKPFHSAMDRLSKGSYQDSVTLIRSLYDAFLRVVHISVYCDNPWGALATSPEPGVPRFNATGLVQDQLRLDWLPNYEIMSVFAHGNVFEVSQSLIRNEQRRADPERFGLVYEDDVRLVEMAMPYLQLLLLLNLRFVRTRLIGSANVRDPGQLKSADRAIELLQWMISDNPKPFWVQTARDVDYLFEVLAAADAGRDWQSMRDLRPKVLPRSARIGSAQAVPQDPE